MAIVTTRSSLRSPQHPLFTTKFFSTKSFGPGHIVGAGILVFGTLALTKFFAARGQMEAARTGENTRGQYGRKLP